MCEYRGFRYLTDLCYGMLDLFAAAIAPISYPKCDRIPDDGRQVMYCCYRSIFIATVTFLILHHCQ